ncbi:33 kDa chaperonin [Caldovatus sediminis]|uniref:33 kDa chaperonin n=1 Tax=Caldovatus sediminis TaxID=2041189 RepID=A0A8J2ZES7_9PROT|nr:33 kDa chaperonin [Caldovatus sediminis]
MPDLVVPRGVLPFHLEGQPIRGRLVRLGPLAEAILSRHEHPPVVATLLGQALALVAGLAAALKFSGSFSLQAQGNGPVPVLLADCTDQGALRGYVRSRPDRLAALLEAGEAPDAAALLGKGHLAFTCDQGPDMTRYQGLVAIEGATLSQMAEHYFGASAQLPTHVHLAAARAGEDTAWRAGALFLERIAVAGRGEPDAAAAGAEAWRTARALAATLTDAELLDDSLPGPALLRRLFATEGRVVLDRARSLSYGCRCSRARLAGILERFPEEDLDHMAEEDGAITMNCEFCNLGFRFERSELQGGARRG